MGTKKREKNKNFVKKKQTGKRVAFGTSFTGNRMPLNFFGKKKQTVTPKESIAKLRETIDVLEKREQFLQKKCDAQVQEAKRQMTQKNKKGIMLFSSENMSFIQRHYIFIVDDFNVI